MCKIIAVLNKNKNLDTSSMINKFLEMQVDKLQLEKDGYAVLRVAGRKITTTYHLNEYDATDIFQNIQYKEEDLLIMHFRTATSGEISKNALHLKPINKRFYFAHNGTTSLATKNISDSEAFAKILVAKNINKNRIEKIGNKIRFSGKMFIYDKKEKELHLFMNSPMHAVALSDNTLIFTTYEPVLKKDLEITKHVLGLRFVLDRKQQTIDYLSRRKLDDKYLVFKEHELVKEEDLKIRSVYYHSYYYQVKPYNYSYWDDEKEGKNVINYEENKHEDYD